VVFIISKNAGLIKGRPDQWEARTPRDFLKSSQKIFIWAGCQALKVEVQDWISIPEPG
jgi:hypothetical protein